MSLSELSLASIAMLIAFGFFQIPVAPDILVSDPAWFSILKWLFALAPLIPLAVVLVGSLIAKPWPRLLVVGMASLIATFGLLLSVSYAILPGIRSPLASIHVFSLTIAVVTFLMVLNTRTISGPWPKLIIIPVVVAIWSISTVVVITIQATRISGDDLFCLASHKVGGQIATFAQLRGLSFYAPVSGNNVTQQWDFHGLLIVSTDDGPVAYNWSPRRATFDAILQPALFSVDPLTACVPQFDFTDGLFVL